MLEGRPRPVSQHGGNISPVRCDCPHDAACHQACPRSREGARCAVLWPLHWQALTQALHCHCVAAAHPVPAAKGLMEAICSPLLPTSSWPGPNFQPAWTKRGAYWLCDTTFAKMSNSRNHTDSEGSQYCICPLSLSSGRDVRRSWHPRGTVQACIESSTRVPFSIHNVTGYRCWLSTKPKDKRALPVCEGTFDLARTAQQRLPKNFDLIAAYIPRLARCLVEIVVRFLAESINPSTANTLKP